MVYAVQRNTSACVQLDGYGLNGSNITLHVRAGAQVFALTSIRFGYTLIYYPPALVFSSSPISSRPLGRKFNSQSIFLRLRNIDLVEQIRARVMDSML